jgi:serine/threonine protein kinase
MAATLRHISSRIPPETGLLIPSVYINNRPKTRTVTDVMGEEVYRTTGFLAFVLSLSKDCRMNTFSNRRFGRYEILDEIGRGAMGVVYRARDPKINRTVAIKSISLTHQPREALCEFRERFLREAEAAGRLSHPGIVTIFDVGEEPETHDPYLVMEYIRGKSLDTVLQEKGKLAPDVAVGLAVELAEALDCAHGQDVIHRDLKPANILLTEDGHAKIADFGVAKLDLDNFTLHGQVLGTPSFMSPEQLNGEPVDGRSDLFSLGVILYMLVTGHRPFQGNSPLTISFKVVNHEPVPAAAFDLDLPTGLDHVLSRALAKDPEQRYQRGMEMSLDLQNILAGHEPWSKAKHPTATSASLDHFKRPQRKVGVTQGSRTYPIEILLRKFGEMFKSSVCEIPKMWTAFPSGGAIALLLLGIGLFSIEWQVSSVRSDRTPPLVALPNVSPGTASDPRAASSTTSAPSSRFRPLTAPRTPDRTAIVSIQVESRFQQGNVTVWVDDQAVFHRKLQPAVKKKLGLFRGAHSPDSLKVQIAPGKHQMRIRVQARNPFYDESHILSGNFPVGTERVLRVSFSKHNEMTASLK